jgi:hypothetical protein
MSEPLCPAGCGCRWPDPVGVARGATDADARDCACDGPCCWDSWDEFVWDLLAYPEDARETFVTSRDMAQYQPFPPLARP